MRIAILTFHRTDNCGAVLQAWALKTVLERMGHLVEFPMVNNVGNKEGFLYYLKSVPYWRKGWARVAVTVKRAWLDLRRFGRVPNATKLFRSFRERFLVERDCTIADLPSHYDLAVIGSDQVWNSELLGNDEPLFLGEAIPRSLSLVSYAASCGDYDQKEGSLRRLAIQLDRFKAVSVREEFARKQIEKYWKGRIDVVADPTLLLTAKEFEPLYGKVNDVRPYLYVYTLYASDELLRLAREVARRMNWDLKVTLAYPLNKNEATPDSIYETDLTPDRMVSYIAGAKAVIAASFHGTALSLILNKPFVSVGDFTWRKLGRRQRTLLESVGLEGRMIWVDEDVERVVAVLKQNLPQQAGEKLALIRQRSQEWLSSAL